MLPWQALDGCYEQPVLGTCSWSACGPRPKGEMRMSFLRRFSGQKPTPPPPSPADLPARWYFLSGTPQTASAAFRALSLDQEFQIASSGDATPDSKFLVRYYSAQDATGTERIAKARRLHLGFHGFACPHEPGEVPQAVDDIGRVCSLLSGSRAAGEAELSLVAVLADQRYDGLMRAYHHDLNKDGPLGAGPTRAELVYCDDSDAAKNLLMLYDIKERSPRHDARFQSWCSGKGISSAPFERGH
jgi:hypothetical protein